MSDYLVSPDKVYEIFSLYIKKNRPELLNLDKDDLRRENKSVYAYEFSDFNTYRLYFLYLWEPINSNPIYQTDDYPVLRVTQKVKNELNGLFGIYYENLIIRWFQNQYKLPVKTVKEL